ncbi:MAG: T9SS type A sorting domain-containing protein [Flavobacteriales bacterium]|nr:T9SS type A sorting domain-containing protein [Flavobacteriales bacterium]
MRLRNTLLTLLGALLMGSTALAQRDCGTMDHLDYQRENDPKVDSKMAKVETHTSNVLASEQRAVNGVVTIPCVVHVVYNTTAENISDAQIMSQITVLNEDFRRTNSDADNTWSQAADTQIEFCLATVDPNGNATTGIVRTYTSVTAFGTNDNMKFSSSGGADAWPAGDYLNLWVCDISGGILGYAQFPGGQTSTDGVAIDYQYFGTIGTATAPFDLGRTATHEVGHWLNLRHIWGDGACGVDDFVSDTPTSDAANYGCAIGHVSCSTTDMVQNYMDYSDDACMNLYTSGQTDRMRALFEPGGFRASLLTSNGCGNGVTPTCDDGIQNGDETGVDCGGSNCAPCVCNGTEVTVSITLDNYPEETSWAIKSGSTTVASGGTYGSQPDGSTVNTTICLPDGCYDFVIYDSYGDGICCSYGSGSYTVSGGGNTLASGGSFGASETTNFCVGGSSGPTCNDGIQNGDETGVDCGGSCAPCATCNDGIQNGNETGVDCGGDCAPCATCNDGIQNGNETGVDCGGDCAACPTCNDGIQNGDETGVDCGGSCAPCGGGGGCTYVVVDYENFNSGWGIWNDGGSDSYRTTAYAYSGSNIRLRDNSSSSVMTTDNMNLSAYDEITVDFTYVPVSMDNSNEDFWLQISTNGGSSYSTVEEWNLGDEFNNNTRYWDNVVISGPFTSNTRLRFRCDASANNDYVYIDEVEVSGCLNSNREIAPEAEQAVELTNIGLVNVYPNPASDVLNVDFELLTSTGVQIVVTDYTGRIVHEALLGELNGKQQYNLDLSEFAQGVYHLHVVSLTDRQSRKFVIYR